MQFSGTDTDPAPLVVRGQTQNTEVKVTHPLSRVAGKIMVESTLISPPRWFCAARCFTLNPWKDKDTIDVGIRGLVALFAAPGDDFVFKPRPAGDTHPQANYGTERLIDGIRVIAAAYREQTDRKPRITDMNLPKGGMFDLHNGWFVDKNNGHVSHHTGNDVDFSALDDGGQSINCFLQSTNEMKDAFKQTKSTFKQCYKKGHYHIRFP